MNCADLDRWLDQGSPAPSHVAAMAHARICARCLAALRAADDLEAALAGPSLPAPAGFAGRVMARVAATAQVRVRIPLTELLPFFQVQPWWVRVALEPAALLAILLASAMVWRGEALFTLATGGTAQLAAWIALAFPAPAAPAAPVVGPAAVIWLQPAVVTSIALATVPLALMASRLLYRWSAGLVAPRHVRLRGR